MTFSRRYNAMFFEVVLLFGLRTLPVAAHRPSQIFSLSLPEGGEDVEQNAHKKEDEFTVTIRKDSARGRYGWNVDPGTGRFRVILPGFPADIAGLQSGQHIIAVGAKRYTYRTLVNCAKTTTCRITVAKSTFPMAASVFRFLNTAAACAGLLMVLSLPWMICQSGTCGPNAFAHPAILFIVGVSTIGGCGQLGINLLDWSYASMVGRVYSVSECVCSFGLAGVCLANRHNPLLDEPLQKDQSEALKHSSLLALALCLLFTVSALCSAFGQWNEGSGALNAIYELHYVPEAILLLIFTSMMAQISTAASQGMVGIAEILSHGNVDFIEQVHEPLAKLLEEVPPKLAICGLSLILVSFSAMANCIPFIHQQLAKILSSETNRTLMDWSLLARPVSWLAAAVCPLAVSLSRLSSGLKRLEAELSEERMRDPSQHSRVEAVEKMLAEANHGQGWGIPVSEGFVLNQTAMQTIGFRLLLAATVIKTFLDSQLGFEEEEANTLLTRLDKVNSTVHNMTDLIGNQTVQNMTTLLERFLEDKRKNQTS